MFGIGSTELLVILVVALLVLGPKNLPKVAQSLGKAMGEFRRYSTEFQRTLNTEIAFDEHNKKQAEAEKELSEATPATASEAASGSLEIPNPAAAVAAPAQSTETAQAETVAAATVSGTQTPESPESGDKA